MSTDLFEQLQNMNLEKGGELQGMGASKITLLTFTVISLVGLAYLTQLAFNTTCTQNMTEYEINATKACAVLLWVSVGLNILGLSYPVPNKMLRTALLAVTLISLVGLGYLTKLAFDEKCTQNMTEYQTNVARMSAILLWLYVSSQVMSNGVDFNNILEKEMTIPF